MSVVIPAHNERDSLRRVGPTSARSRSWSHEIVLVDDGSSDGTWGEIRALTAERSGVRGIRFTRNFGHQAALAAGLRAASGSAVIDDGCGRAAPGWPSQRSFACGRKDTPLCRA